MGRSPALATETTRVSRPALRTTSPSGVNTSPGFMYVRLRDSVGRSLDRIVDRDQLGPVGEGRLDLHFLDHFGDALHDVVDAEDRAAAIHELGDRQTIPCPFENSGADQGNRLGIVELEPARAAALGEQRGGEQEKLVLLAWR